MVRKPHVWRTCYNCGDKLVVDMEDYDYINEQRTMIFNDSVAGRDAALAQIKDLKEEVERLRGELAIKDTQMVNYDILHGARELDLHQQNERLEMEVVRLRELLMGENR